MKKRVDWVDLAKGIVIVLMVVGHTSIPEPISKWIWSFHMPFFFLVSGVFFNEQKYGAWTMFAESRIRQLVIPYVLMTIVVFISLYPLGNVQFDELICGWMGYPLWFMPVLLMAETLGLCVIKVRNKNVILAITIVFLLGAYILWITHWHCAYKLESVLLACSFFILGWLLKGRLLKLHIRLWIILIIAAFHLVLSQLLPKLDMCFYDLGSWANPLNAFLGIVIVMVVSKRFVSSRKLNAARIFLIWAGKNTLIIMGFASMLIILMNALIEFTTIPKIITSFAKHIMLWGLLYILTILINKYVPEMAGKKRK